MQEVPALQTAWLRYGSALFCIFLLHLGKIPTTSFRSGWRYFPWIALLGLCTFFLSSIFQYKGLALSSATANTLIVAMEPLFAVFLAWIFLRERLHWIQILAFFVAVVGFLLLSNLKPHDWQNSLALFSFGNLFLLLSMPMEAMYSIISRKLAGKIQPISVFSWALGFGFCVFSLYLVWEGVGFPRSLSLQGYLAVLWLGPLGTALTYTFWTMALVKAPVAAVSLTLFVQPILGAAFGAFFLGERLDGWQAFGGILILATLVLQTKLTLKGEQNVENH